MDFLKILRSFEEFVFEATAWLLFYPMTVWRIMRHPLAAMAYSDRQQHEPEERRYDEAMSPPLVLLVTLVLANLVAAAAHVPPPEEAAHLAHSLLNSQQNLVLFRSLLFSLVPLISAASLVHLQKKQLSRQSLMEPFYAQCYLAAPCACFVGLGGLVLQRPDLANIYGVAIIAAGTLWFLWVQSAWFAQKLDVTRARGAVLAAWAMARAVAYMLVILIPFALF